jgi:hypothetical protein
MTKKVIFSAKPTQEKSTPSADQWVQSRNVEGSKRVTIDMPKNLHTQIRIDCLRRGVNMTEELRTVLVDHYKMSPPA